MDAQWRDSGAIGDKRATTRVAPTLGDVVGAFKLLTTVEYSFCPRCGGPLASRKLKPSEPERLVCTRCGFIFFLDPKVAAGTLFTIEGKIPLLQRAIEPSYGKWVFPGGFVDRGEAVQDAAVRETREEARLEVRLVSLLNVYSYSGSPVILVVYAAEVIGGELEAGDECLDVRLFAPGEIPWQELAFPSTREAVGEYVERFLSKG